MSKKITKDTPFMELREQDIFNAYEEEVKRICGDLPLDTKVIENEEDIMRASFFRGFLDGCNNLATIYKIDIRK